MAWNAPAEAGPASSRHVPGAPDCHADEEVAGGVVDDVAVEPLARRRRAERRERHEADHPGSARPQVVDRRRSRPRRCRRCSALRRRSAALTPLSHGGVGHREHGVGRGAEVRARRLSSRCPTSASCPGRAPAWAPTVSASALAAAAGPADTSSPPAAPAATPPASFSRSRRLCDGSDAPSDPRSGAGAAASRRARQAPPRVARSSATSALSAIDVVAHAVLHSPATCRCRRRARSVVELGARQRERAGRGQVTSLGAQLFGLGLQLVGDEQSGAGGGFPIVTPPVPYAVAAL